MRLNVDSEVRFGWSEGFPKVFLIQAKNPLVPDSSFEIELTQQEAGELFEVIRTNKLLPPNEDYFGMRLG